jgi:hypothetical protein
VHFDRDTSLAARPTVRAVLRLRYWRFRLADACEGLGVWLGARLWDLADWLRGDR